LRAILMSGDDLAASVQRRIDIRTSLTRSFIVFCSADNSNKNTWRYST
jgi:hypothetical protein